MTASSRQAVADISEGQLRSTSSVEEISFGGEQVTMCVRVCIREEERERESLCVPVQTKEKAGRKKDTEMESLAHWRLLFSSFTSTLFLRVQLCNGTEFCKKIIRILCF